MYGIYISILHAFNPLSRLTHPPEPHIPTVKPFNQRDVVAWEREVRLLVAKATCLPALVHVVLIIAEFLLGRLRYVLRVRVQLAPVRTKAWGVIVFAGRRRRRCRRWLVGRM